MRHLAPAAAGLAIWSSPAVATAGSPYLIVPNAERVEASPAYRYANMTTEDALAELDRRGVSYRREWAVEGVRAPIRLTGPLRGIDIHSTLPPEKRANSPFEILDARLALALDDFCALLASHDVVEILHYTMYRPNVPHASTHAHASDAPSARKRGGEQSAPKASTATERKGASKSDSKSDRRATTGKHKSLDKKGTLRQKAPSGKPASEKKQKPAKVKKTRPAPATKAAPKPATKAASPTGRRPKTVAARVGKLEPKPRAEPKPAPPGTRHPAGLAIDVGGLRKRDGTWLSVAHDFHGQLGSQTCGAGAPTPQSAKAKELRTIVCDSFEQGIFTYVLTPNFDQPHADHFHMEIKPEVRWFLYH